MTKRGKKESGSSESPDSGRSEVVELEHANEEGSTVTALVVSARAMTTLEVVSAELVEGLDRALDQAREAKILALVEVETKKLLVEIGLLEALTEFGRIKETDDEKIPEEIDEQIERVTWQRDRAELATIKVGHRNGRIRLEIYESYDRITIDLEDNGKRVRLETKGDFYPGIGAWIGTIPIAEEQRMALEILLALVERIKKITKDWLELKREKARQERLEKAGNAFEKIAGAFGLGEEE